MSARTRAPLVALLVVCGGCDADNPPPLPDNELLVEVQKAKYTRWMRAPGKDERTPSQAPHAGAVEVFINEVIVEALANKDGLGLTEWPEGATAVLEGYVDTETTELAQVAIMQKRHGVWYWEQYQAENLEAPRFSGRPDICLGCHNTGQDFTRSFSLPKVVEEEE